MMYNLNRSRGLPSRIGTNCQSNEKGFASLHFALLRCVTLLLLVLLLKKDMINYQSLKR